MREVKPTQKPVPSSDIKDLFFNSGLLDIWATSLERKYIDRFGNCHLTAAGMEWLFKELVEKFKVDMNTAIVAAGYITIDSFQKGADLPNNELTQRNHILRDETTGEYYRWDGDLPKQVPAGSTPQSTGGIGKGAWVSVGDASLRTIAQYRANNIEALKSSPFAVGGIVNIAGYYNVFDGAQHYRVISDTDDGTGVHLNNGLWANIIINGDACVDWFGAKGNGIDDDWWAIDKAINASLSTEYQGDWEKTSRRNPKFNVRLSRRSYRITKQILLPPYMKFYGMGSRWYFSGLTHSVLIPDFENPLQFAVQSANYLVDTGELIGQGYFSGVLWLDTKKMTATHGIVTYGYSIEPKNQILGGVRLVGSPTSEVYDIFANKIDCGVILNCSWCSKVDVRTEHIKFGVYSGQDGNNSHVDGYYTGGTGTPLAGNPYLNPIESLDPSTGLSTQKISDPNSKIGAIFYWSQGTTSTNLTSEGNDHSLAVAKGAADVRCLYTEKNKASSVVGYNSQLTIGEITGANDESTFCMGVNNDWTLEKDTQTGVSKRFKYVDTFGNRIKVPLAFKEYTRGICVDGHDFNIVTVNSTSGNDDYVGTQTSPVKTIDRALELLRLTYTKSDRALTNTGARRIIISDSASYTLSYENQMRGGELEIVTTASSRPTISFNVGLRLYNIDVTSTGININRPNVDYGVYDQGAFWFEGGTINVNLGSANINLAKYELSSLRAGFSGMVTLNMNNVALSAPADSSIIHQAYQNNDGHLVNVFKFSTTYSGGIESRSDKGLNIPNNRIIHTLGVY